MQHGWAERGDSGWATAGMLALCGGWLSGEGPLLSHLHPDHSGMLKEHLFPIVVSH